jgi:hypothetical protein
MPGFPYNLFSVSCGDNDFSKEGFGRKLACKLVLSDLSSCGSLPQIVMAVTCT